MLTGFVVYSSRIKSAPHQHWRTKTTNVAHVQAPLRTCACIADRTHKQRVGSVRAVVSKASAHHLHQVTPGKVSGVLCTNLSDLSRPWPQTPPTSCDLPRVACDIGSAQSSRRAYHERNLSPTGVVHGRLLSHGSRRHRTSSQTIAHCPLRCPLSFGSHHAWFLRQTQRSSDCGRGLP